MSASIPRLILLSTLLAACSSSSAAPHARTDMSEPSEPPIPASSTVCDEAAGGSSEGSTSRIWPAPLEVYLTDSVDAVNLSLDTDGSFRIFVDGCDYFGCESGVWTLELDDVVLRPPEGAGWVDWPGSPAAPSMRLTRGTDGVVYSLVDETSDEKLTWERGTICPRCTASPGPGGFCRCAEPLPATCWQ